MTGPGPPVSVAWDPGVRLRGEQVVPRTWGSGSSNPSVQGPEASVEEGAGDPPVRGFLWPLGALLGTWLP